MKKEKQKASSTKVTSQTSQTSKSDCSECITFGHIGAAILTVALAAVALWGLHWFFTEPKFEEWNCVISKDYKFFRVDEVDRENELYTLTPMTGHCGTWSCYLVRDFDGREQRTRDFSAADDGYLEVPCDR